MALENATKAPPNPVKRPTSDVPAEVPRDRWDRPRIRPRPGAEIPKMGWTRASTFGGYLEDQFNLGRWRQAVVAWGMARDRAARMEALTIGGFAEQADKAALYKIVDRVWLSSDADAKANLGTALHALSEQIDRGAVFDDLGEDQHAVDAYRAFMVHFRIHRSEVFVVCERWQVAGTFDRTVSPNGFLVAPDGTVYGPDDVLVFDLKTSSTADYFGIKFTVQLTVYAHGELYDPETGERAALGADRRWALILHLPSGGAHAELYWVDLRRGEELCDEAARVREARKLSSKLIILAAPPVAEVDLCQKGCGDPRTHVVGSCGVAVDPSYSPSTVVDAARTSGTKALRPEDYPDGRRPGAHAAPIAERLQAAAAERKALDDERKILAELEACGSRADMLKVHKRHEGGGWTDACTARARELLAAL